MTQQDSPDILDPCTGCGFCGPCPNGIDIVANMQLWVDMTRGVERDVLVLRYAHLRLSALPANVRGSHAGACFDCGECEARCPKDVRIIGRLRDLHAALGAPNAT